MAKQIKREHIAAIYAAVTEDDTLRRMSTVLMEALDADSSGMWLIDQGRIKDITGTADVQASATDYLAYYQKIDVWGGANPSIIDQVSLGHEKIDDALLLKSEFYNDFARHYGMRDPMGIVMSLGPGMYASIGLNRTNTRKLFCEEDKPLLAELAYHVEAALKLSHCFDAKIDFARQRHSAFDTLRFGAVICAKDGVVRYANAAAEQMAARGSGFTLGTRMTGIGGMSPSGTETLRRLVVQAADGRGGGCRIEGRDGIMVSVMATPFVDNPSGGDPAALLALRRDDASPAASAGMLRDLFGFSPAQTALATMLLDGATFEEAASRRGIAMTTARSHFDAILAKTKARNLRDFLRVVGSLPDVG